MSFSKAFRSKVNKKVHILAKRRDYTISFYTGGVDIDNWSNLTESERKTALSKNWKICWWYRNPETDILERMTDIKAGINRFTTKTERLKFMNTYRSAMIETLDEGFNPYSYKEAPEREDNTKYTAGKAIDYALSIRKSTVSPETYVDYEREAKSFKEYLFKKGRLQHDISFINRKTVSDYLDTVLQKTSAKRRNNVRGTLSSLFTALSDKFIIKTNFIKNDISKERTTKKADRRFTVKELQRISDHLKEKDPLLLLFLKIVSYNFLRPIEVCRLTVGDIDLDAREMYFDQKTKKGKTKLIPEIYFEELKELVTGQPREHCIFTPQRRPGPWDTTDKNKRDYWSKQFKKKVKIPLEISTDMYGARHTYITALYAHLTQKLEKSKSEALDVLMMITGHTSRDGISAYIHENDIAKPKDWSSLIDIKL